jgi:hypothetical protein
MTIPIDKIPNMVISIDPILQKIPSCVWAHSNQYFLNDHRLRKIDFVGTLDTDIDVQTSFSIPGKIPLSGALIRTFNNDNMEHEHFMLYQLLLNTIDTQDIVTVRLQKKDFFSLLTVKNILAAMPLVSLILFNLLILILPALLRNILMYIGLGSLVIVSLIYLFIGIRFLIRFLRIQKNTIAEKEISYIDPQDMEVMNEQHIKALIPLEKKGIASAVFFQNRLYIKQSLNDDTRSEEDIQKMIEDTIVYFGTDSFTTVFS